MSGIRCDSKVLILLLRMASLWWPYSMSLTPSMAIGINPEVAEVETDVSDPWHAWVYLLLRE